jgi:hypothetical protein
MVLVFLRFWTLCYRCPWILLLGRILKGSVKEGRKEGRKELGGDRRPFIVHEARHGHGLYVSSSQLFF